MACIVVDYIGMADIVMAYIVMACIVMAAVVFLYLDLYGYGLCRYVQKKWKSYGLCGYGLYSYGCCHLRLS